MHTASHAIHSLCFSVLCYELPALTQWSTADHSSSLNNTKIDEMARYSDIKKITHTKKTLILVYDIITSYTVLHIQQGGFLLQYSRFVLCSQIFVLYRKIRLCPVYFHSDVYNANHT